MKQSILFLFLLFVPFLFSAPNVSAQAGYLSTAELKKILSDRTFLITASDDIPKSSHIYFASDGKYTILFPSGNVRSSDTWKIDENNNFCLRRARRSGSGTDYISHCGKVSLAGANALTLYNEKGDPYKILQLVGNGDLLK
ncbi:MAG: hypothetical protein KKC76_14800 [Proteobacteria bacterium]|nr:hypothetical protein [Pseudomonadota bacterium]MBU4294326.1 hypothetical protein [Pseudomonadota bacterium]MCG2749113.1 hypothetical protein [Desulfobulbaceae bacterium]